MKVLCLKISHLWAVAMLFLSVFLSVFLAVALLTTPIVFAQTAFAQTAFAQTAFAQTTFTQNHAPLLKNDEKVLVSFVIQDSNKILTVATAIDDSYIVYRYGRNNAIELEYPDAQQDSSSWENFTHKRHLRGVGDANLALDMSYLEFQNYGYTYRVYDAYSAEFSKAFVGVIVIEHSTGKEYDIQAIPETKFGGLSSLDAYSMIQARAAF